MREQPAMHNHQTFIPMVVDCECCLLPNEFRFTSKHDRVICKSCLPHTGSPEKQARKLRDHNGLYLSELRLAQEQLLHTRFVIDAQGMVRLHVAR